MKYTIKRGETPDRLTTALEKYFSKLSPRLRLFQRIFQNIKVNQKTGCWEWTGKLDKDGYAQFGILNQTFRVHRTTYGLFVKPIPDALVCDHLCRVRSCVNPAHLEPVTNAINSHRGFGITGINYRKTHCTNGHPLSGENLKITATKSTSTGTTRTCLTCFNKNQATKNQRRREKNPPKPKTYCKWGHEFDEKNTRFREHKRDGGRIVFKSRVCRTCEKSKKRKK